MALCVRFVCMFSLFVVSKKMFRHLLGKVGGEFGMLTARRAGKLILCRVL